MPKYLDRPREVMRRGNDYITTPDYFIRVPFGHPEGSLEGFWKDRPESIPRDSNRTGGSQVAQGFRFPDHRRWPGRDVVHRRRAAEFPSWRTVGEGEPIMSEA